MPGAVFFVIRRSFLGKQAIEQQVEIGPKEGLLVGSGHAAVVEYQPQNRRRQDGRDHDFREFHRNFAKLPDATPSRMRASTLAMIGSMN